VDTAALFATLRVLLRRTPLLIQAHLPPQERHIPFPALEWREVVSWAGGGATVVVSRDRLWQCTSDVPQPLPGTGLLLGQATLSAQLTYS